LRQRGRQQQQQQRQQQQQQQQSLHLLHFSSQACLDTSHATLHTLQRCIIAVALLYDLTITVVLLYY
jgi:hypothetical protein